ncbi:Uncharacterised protein [Mycobacteroides abscessus subsp. abscessus]|nr:Uncharacterised protein [Mycobacteroides abscessus subsp. abscessus]
MACWSALPQLVNAVATPEGAKIGRARPMSPYERASATRELVTVERCEAMPSKSSGMLMAVTPSSATLLSRSSG